MKQKCKGCGNNFKIISKNGLCYYCFTNKEGRSPTEKEHTGDTTVKMPK